MAQHVDVPGTVEPTFQSALGSADEGGLASVPLQSIPLDAPPQPPTTSHSTPSTDPLPSSEGPLSPQVTSPKPPPLDSPFFTSTTTTNNNNTAAATSTTTLPTSSNLVSISSRPNSPMSPHPMDSIKPPQFLQVEESYRNLIYTDGYDTHGRPVIVLNTSALPPKSKKEQVLVYLRDRLMPIVNEGPYVLVLVACTAGPNYKSLPALWTISAYRSLARPFHKNVHFVIMVNPSLLVRTVLAMLKPFVKPKAYRKLKKVHSLLEMDEVTNGEVRLEHLGQTFLSSMQRTTQ